MYDAKSSDNNVCWPTSQVVDIPAGDNDERERNVLPAEGDSAPTMRGAAAGHFTPAAASTAALGSRFIGTVQENEAISADRVMCEVSPPIAGLNEPLFSGTAACNDSAGACESVSEEKEINPPSASAAVICATPSPNVCAVSASDNDDDLQFIKPLLDTLPDSVTDEERQEIQSLL